jgi:tRNA-2-methylthio-N6-dimethylallyladenosine synthase
MQDKVPEKEKTLRLEILQDLQKEITLSRNKELEGRQIEVLIEGRSKRGNQLTGRSETNKIVNLTNNTYNIGDIANVLIKDSFFNSLRA